MELAQADQATATLLTINLEFSVEFLLILERGDISDGCPQTDLEHNVRLTFHNLTCDAAWLSPSYEQTLENFLETGSPYLVLARS